MDNISIDLQSWENAPIPICTTKVDLETAEKELYRKMRMKWGYDNNDIQTFLNECGNQFDREKFLTRLCEEEENVILDNGGFYYEDVDF